MSALVANQLPLTLGDRRRVLRSCCQTIIVLLLVLIWGNAIFGSPLRDYRERVKKAISSLDLLHEIEELPPSQRDVFVLTNLRLVREALPRKETVEWNGTNFLTDNSWLDDELKEFEKISASDRAPVLDRILEQLQALEERLEEIDKTVGSTSPSKSELNARLAAILHRPEYAKAVKEESALSRLLRRLFKWISNLVPKRRPLDPSGASAVSKVAQIFVVVIALAGIAYVLHMFGPRFLRHRQAKKKRKPQARVVLGERLEPDQSAADLLAEAEALARAGDLRGAIRRGYIALLVELADRKIISLAQHKTNRDYLRAVREVQNLYRNLETLTNNFEQHWYGLVPASESDWVAFRAGYRRALQE